MCIIILINPSSYSKSCLNAVSVWTLNILPLMFPFFVLTRILTELNPPKQNIMDKFFKIAYNAPTGSFGTFMLSVMSGYPMGAKLICSMNDKGYISQTESKTMLSFCSISGPIFMIGTVGVAFLNSYKAGLIIFTANLIGALLNGLLYRGKTLKNCNPLGKKLEHTENLLTESVLDSLKSILMICGYLILSFLIIEILTNLNIIKWLSVGICSVFNISHKLDLVSSILCGSMEITNGLLTLSSLNISLATKTIISSGLIGFGGLSVLLQSMGFMRKLHIPVKTLLLQKLTQGVFCICISFVLCVIFF